MTVKKFLIMSNLAPDGWAYKKYSRNLAAGTIETMSEQEFAEFCERLELLEDLRVSLEGLKGEIDAHVGGREVASPSPRSGPGIAMTNVYLPWWKRLFGNWKILRNGGV